MGRGSAPIRWDTQGLALIGAYFGWLLIFAHEAYEIVVSLGGCSHNLNPFAHFDIHPVGHMVIELIVGGLIGALLFASASEIRNRLMQAP
jgi:hypothetical protein